MFGWKLNSFTLGGKKDQTIDEISLVLEVGAGWIEEPQRGRRAEILFNKKMRALRKEKKKEKEIKVERTTNSLMRYPALSLWS